MKECDAAVGPFSTRFMNIPTADEINNELSTAFSRKVHCSDCNGCIPHHSHDHTNAGGKI